MEITIENIKNARTYLKIGAKQRLAEQIAGWVVTKVEPDTDQTITVHPLYKENRALKNMLMTGILCRYYLNMEFECDTVSVYDTEGNLIEKQPVDFFPTMEAYDEIASSAIMNQLERLKKKDKDNINIIFDFMYDYKTLEQMVNAEIKDYLAQKNDVVARVISTLEFLISNQNLESLKEQIDTLQKELTVESGGE